MSLEPTEQCPECGGDYETVSAMVSDDYKHFIKAVKCTECGYETTLKIKRAAPYTPIRAIC